MNKKLILSLFLCGALPHAAAEDASSSSSSSIHSLSAEKIARVEQLKTKQLDIQTKLTKLSTMSVKNQEQWEPIFKNETVVGFVAESLAPFVDHYKEDLNDRAQQEKLEEYLPVVVFLSGYTGDMKSKKDLRPTMDTFFSYFMKGGTESDPTEAVNQFIAEREPTEKTCIYYIYTSSDWAEHLIDKSVTVYHFGDLVTCKSFCIYWPDYDAETMKSDYFMKGLWRFNGEEFDNFIFRKIATLQIRSSKILPVIN